MAQRSWAQGSTWVGPIEACPGRRRWWRPANAHEHGDSVEGPPPADRTEFAPDERAQRDADTKGRLVEDDRPTEAP